MGAGASARRVGWVGSRKEQKSTLVVPEIKQDKDFLLLRVKASLAANDPSPIPQLVEGGFKLSLALNQEGVRI